MEPITFVVVEDDDVDMMSIKRALKGLNLKNPIIRAKDGLAALELLHGSDAQPAMESPYIILLDLNMPRMNGLDFLAALRKNPMTEMARVFVLTTSETDQDILNAHTHNIMGYIFKSDLLGSLGEAIDSLENSWMLLG